MNSCAVVELEEGALTVTVGQLRGRKVHSSRTVHVPLPDQEQSTLVSILASLSSDMLRDVAAVHLVLGDRRMHHFRCDVPRMSGAEVEEFVRREAMRHTGLHSQNDVMVAVGKLRRLAGGALRVGAVALPRTVWDTVHKTFADAGVKIAALYSLESCLCLLAPSMALTAIVECGVGRARFVVSEDRVVLQVRRFMVGSSVVGNSEAIGAQLSLELPRTFEWLREAGNGAPTTMVLGPRAAAGIKAIGMDLDGMPPVVARHHQLPVATGDSEPPIACSALLRAIVAGVPPPSLLEPLRITLPIGSSRVAVLASAMAVVAVAGWWAVAEGRRWDLAGQRVQELTQARVQLDAAAQVAQQASAIASDDAHRLDVRLQRALGTRRPVSLLFADLARAARLVRLDAIDCGGEEKVTLSGFVSAASRRDALEEVARFLREVRSLPYLVPLTGEEIGEVPGMLHGFRFKVGLAWRSS